MKILFFLSVSIFINYCTSDSSNVNQTQTKKTNFLKKAGTVDKDKVEKIKRSYEAWLNHNYSKRVFPTIVTGVVKGGELVYSYKLGANEKTNYSLGSITKTFTGTMIMRAIEKGLINLDDPVSKYFPKLKLENPILNSKTVTIRNLLSHTSGMPDLRYYSSGLYHKKQETDLPFDVTYQIYPTGVHYRYSNHGFQLLGEILKLVHKKPLDQVIKDELFTPIGMTDSMVAPTVTGAGGIMTNMQDMSRYAMMWLAEGKSITGTQVLKPETVNRMIEVQTNIPPSKTKKYCGLAWRTERDEEGVTTFFHIGGANYTAGWVQMFPKYDVAVFYLSNPPEYDDHLMSQLISMQYKLGDLASAIVGADIQIHRTPNTFPDKELLEKYTGNYQGILNNQTAKITLENENLYFNFTGRRFTIPFYTINVTSGPGGQGAYEFAYDPNTKKIIGFSSYNAFYKKLE
jgi:CubicO group peptidase (beta-lactamase class C family)